MKSIHITLRGITPLLMHAYPRVPIEGLDKKTPEEQAEYAAYRDPETKGLYVPGVAVQRALIGAASFSKGKGRASLSKSAAACLMVSPERIPLGVDKYVVDTQPVVIPATKGRVLRHRPRLDRWEIRFLLEFDEQLIRETELRKIIDDMGSRVGLLDFRPQKFGSFGRCMVIHWEPEKTSQAA